MNLPGIFATKTEILCERCVIGLLGDTSLLERLSGAPARANKSQPCHSILFSTPHRSLMSGSSGLVQSDSLRAKA